MLLNTSLQLELTVLFSFHPYREVHFSSFLSPFLSKKSFFFLKSIRSRIGLKLNMFKIKQI